MQEPADTELLRQYAEEGSETAFETLVGRHVGLVYSAALRKTGNAHTAEEITQAVFIILAKKARALRKETILAGWLYQAARLTAANFLRTEIRRVHREQEANMQSLPDEPEVWPQIVPLLDDAMGRLNAQERNAVLLRFFEGKSFQEIGAAVGGTENAAKKRVAYALEKLRKFFAGRGVESTGDAIAGAISNNSINAAPAGLAKAVSVVAAAKGAAASTSTLTLVKGALKIMAWTKTKIAIVAGAAALLTIGTGTVVTLAAMKAMDKSQTALALSTMQGSWEGTLNADSLKLRIVLNIFKTNDTYRATMDSVDQGAVGLPVPTLSARTHSIHAALPAIGGDFHATLSADGTEMDGTWKQLKRSFPLTLKKTTTPDAVAEMTTDQYVPRADSDLQGPWTGVLVAGGVSLHLNLRIAETAPGTFQAVMDSVDQGAMNLPITTFAYDKPQVRFEMKGINAVFNGKVNGPDDKIIGTWSQMGGKLPLTFARVDTNALAAAEAQKDYGQGGSTQLQGHWKGALNISGQQLHIIFHIALMPDGSYSATMDSPDQGAAGIPANTVTFTYPNTRMTWKLLNGVFTGKLDAGKLSGTWRQGKVSLPLRLDRDMAE